MDLLCPKCKVRTGTHNAVQVTMKNGQPAVKGTCADCGTRKFRFVGAAT